MWCKATNYVLGLELSIILGYCLHFSDYFMHPRLFYYRTHNWVKLFHRICSNIEMPKVRRSRKRPPEGWELIEPTIDELEAKMREGIKIFSSLIDDVRFLLWYWLSKPGICMLYTIFKLFFNYILAETEPHDGKRRVESLWPIFRIHHQKSRYIYDLYFKRKAISRGMYYHTFWNINFYLFVCF